MSTLRSLSLPPSPDNVDDANREDNEPHSEPFRHSRLLVECVPRSRPKIQVMRVSAVQDVGGAAREVLEKTKPPSSVAQG